MSGADGRAADWQLTARAAQGEPITQVGGSSAWADLAPDTSYTLTERPLRADLAGRYALEAWTCVTDRDPGTDVVQRHGSQWLLPPVAAGEKVTCTARSVAADDGPDVPARIKVTTLMADGAGAPAPRPDFPLTLLLDQDGARQQIHHRTTDSSGTATFDVTGSGQRLAIAEGDSGEYRLKSGTCVRYRHGDMSRPQDAGEQSIVDVGDGYGQGLLVVPGVTEASDLLECTLVNAPVSNSATTLRLEKRFRGTTGDASDWQMTATPTSGEAVSMPGDSSVPVDVTGGVSYVLSESAPPLIEARYKLDVWMCTTTGSGGHTVPVDMSDGLWRVTPPAGESTVCAAWNGLAAPSFEISQQVIGQPTPLGGRLWRVTYQLTVSGTPTAATEFIVTDVPTTGRGVDVESASLTRPGETPQPWKGPEITGTLPASPTEVSIQYTLDITYRLDDSYDSLSCSSGGGLANAATLTAGDFERTADVACANLAEPYVTASAGQPSVQLDAGGAATGAVVFPYTITVHNDSDLPLRYDLTDTWGDQGHSGLTAVASSAEVTPDTIALANEWGNPLTLSTGALATGVAIEPHDQHVYTVTITMRASSLPNGGTAQCAGVAVTNEAVLSAIGEHRASDTGCLELGDATVAKTLVPGSFTPDADTGAWQASYLLTVTPNDPQRPVFYTLEDLLQPGAGIDLTGVTGTAAFLGTNPTGPGTDLVGWSRGEPLATAAVLPPGDGGHHYRVSIKGVAVDSLDSQFEPECADDGGLVNGAHLTTSAGTDSAAECTTIPVGSVALTKEVETQAYLGSGRWRVGYEVTVRNPDPANSGAPAAWAQYRLTDQMDFPAGWLVDHGAAVDTTAGSAKLNPDWDPVATEPAALELATGSLGPGAEHTFAVVIEAQLPAGLAPDATECGAQSGGLRSSADVNTGLGPVGSQWACASVTLFAVGRDVWRDDNGNGVDEPDEPRVAGVRAKLLTAGGAPARNAAGALVPDQVSNAAGQFWFDELPAGSYQVAFSQLPAGTEFTRQHAPGTPPDLDSDPQPSTGRTDVISLSLSAPQVESANTPGLVQPGRVLWASAADPTRDAGVVAVAVDPEQVPPDVGPQLPGSGPSAGGDLVHGGMPSDGGAAAHSAAAHGAGLPGVGLTRPPGSVDRPAAEPLAATGPGDVGPLVTLSAALALLGALVLLLRRRIRPTT